MSLQNLPISPFFFLFDWIEKRSSHGCLLESLESSDSKIMMIGSVVCEFAWEEMDEQRSLKTKFHSIYGFDVVPYISEVFKESLGSFSS